MPSPAQPSPQRLSDQVEAAAQAGKPVQIQIVPAPEKGWINPDVALGAGLAILGTVVGVWLTNKHDRKKIDQQREDAGREQRLQALADFGAAGSNFLHLVLMGGVQRCVVDDWKAKKPTEFLDEKVLLAYRDALFKLVDNADEAEEKSRASNLAFNQTRYRLQVLTSDQAAFQAVEEMYDSVIASAWSIERATRDKKPAICTGARKTLGSWTVAQALLLKKQPQATPYWWTDWLKKGTPTALSDIQLRPEHQPPS